MILFDTDALVDLLREKRYEAGAISVLTLVEVLRGVAAEKRALTKKLLEEGFTVLGLDNRIIETYCFLYWGLKKEGVAVPDIDPLIAATAMSHELALKTGDDHIRRLAKFGLKLGV